MGIIDMRTYKLTCAKCEATQSSTVVQKGSVWGGASWGAAATFSNFNTTWSDSGADEPQLQSAFCKECDIPASVESSYHS